jgi:hypothetical protein
VHGVYQRGWRSVVGVARSDTPSGLEDAHPKGHTITSNVTFLNCTHNDSISPTNCKIYSRNLFPQPEIVEIPLSGSVVSLIFSIFYTQLVVEEEVGESFQEAFC